MGNQSLIDNIEKYGMNGSVKDNLIKYLKGGKLSRPQAMKCKCYDCNGYNADGRKDCGVKHCPLYPWMPYNPANKKTKKADVDKTQSK